MQNMVYWELSCMEGKGCQGVTHYSLLNWLAISKLTNTVHCGAICNVYTKQSETK